MFLMQRVSSKSDMKRVCRMSLDSLISHMDYRGVIVNDAAAVDELLAEEAPRTQG